MSAAWLVYIAFSIRERSIKHIQDASHRVTRSLARVSGSGREGLGTNCCSARLFGSQTSWLGGSWGMGEL